MTLLIILILLLIFGIGIRHITNRFFSVPMVVLLAWIPALCLTSLPYEFTIDVYWFMNSGIDLVAYMVFFAMFALIALGSVLTYGVYGKKLQTSYVPFPRVSRERLYLVFLIGLSAYLFAYTRSGLSATLFNQSDVFTVLSLRQNFHIGPINHLILLLDLCAIFFFIRYLQFRKATDLLPVLITLIAYLVTYQKARVIYVIMFIVFTMTLYPDYIRAIIWQGAYRKVKLLCIFAVTIVGFLWVNGQRGMSELDVMSYQSPLVEQVFIYSGAPALLNMSATLSGKLPSSEPQYGLSIIRGIIWSFVDREKVNPTVYLEGINNGTILIYWWHDFRWYGLFLIPLLFGALLTYMILRARSGLVFPIVVGAIAFTALLMSVYTDIISEGTTVIYLILAKLMDIFTREPRKRAAK